MTLHQKEREFIKIHFTGTRTPGAVAQLLDDKEQFRKAASISILNANGSNGLAAKIDAKFDAFTAMMEPC